jgi:hypothetical protein
MRPRGRAKWSSFHPRSEGDSPPRESANESPHIGRHLFGVVSSAWDDAHNDVRLVLPAKLGEWLAGYPTSKDHGHRRWSTRIRDDRLLVRPRCVCLPSRYRTLRRTKKRHAVLLGCGGNGFSCGQFGRWRGVPSCFYPLGANPPPALTLAERSLTGLRLGSVSLWLTDLLKAQILDAVLLPAFEIEVPPFRFVDGEPLRLHRPP